MRAVRNRQPLSVLMLDLDDFKLVNDTFGHVYGDRVLVHVAELVRSTLRASDVAGRYGGDEFAVILPETGREGRGHGPLSASWRRSMMSPLLRRGPASRSRSGRRSASPRHPADGRTATELVAVADRALRREARRRRGRAPGWGAEPSRWTTL